MSSTGSTISVPPMEDLVAGRGLRTSLQPIVRVPSGRGFAYEALVRHAIPMLTPDFLFDYADRKGRTRDLDLRVLGLNVEAYAASGIDRPLFVNLHPLSLSDPEEVVETILEVARRASFDLTRLVVEITEQASIPDEPAAVEALRELSDHGVRIALDDVGAAYSHFTLLETVRCSFLKISQTFGFDLEHNEARQKVVRNMVRLAADFDMQVILEGIETAETVRIADGLGIDLGQGFHFARPRPIIEIAMSADA